MYFSKRECPVPFEQQPINEYLTLKKTWLFNYSAYSNQKYILTILLVFMISFIILLVFSVYLVPHPFNLWKVCLLNLWILNIIFIFVLLRLYLGWSYVLKRLLSATVFYEESGWYDGQVWIKQPSNLTQDRLIGIYHIVPIITKLKYTAMFVLILSIISSCLYYLL